jgi:signal transduction histidine kinase
MKRSWVSNLAVGGVILLLTLFLGLQYNWQRQAGDAERERMQRRVEADAKSFAEDFNREMQAAFFNFQMDASAWEAEDWAQFNRRYDFWKGRTQYPELITDLIFIGKEAGRTLKYDSEKRAFIPAETPGELVSLREKIERGGGPVPQFDESSYSLVMPLHETEKRLDRIVIERTKEGMPPIVRMPGSRGYLVIMLDKATISGKILPALAEKHFGDGDYHLVVKNNADEQIFQTAGSLSTPDARAALFNMSPDNMIFFAEHELSSSGETQAAVKFDQHIESHTFSRIEKRTSGAETGSFNVRLKPGGPDFPGEPAKARTSIVAMRTSGEDDPWTLNVQHVSGSINSFIDAERNKSFAIGLGIYMLLVGAIVAIVLSAMRSKRYARQQIDFVSSVSHEFRTPLAVIYSASENLADGVTKDQDQVSQYGNLIKSEGKKLSSMVEQILEFAGARSGRRKYNFTQTDVSDVANAAMEECRPLLEEKGFVVETAISDNLPPLKADAEALSSAIQNLIQNSIKYSNGSRWISVSASNGGGKIKLTVADRGIGVGAGDLKHIFEPFFRGRNVVDAQIRGNGLGLALVKEIAEAHGGSVNAKSELGKGSEFTIELPS